MAKAAKKKPAKKNGRPSSYSENLADKICELIGAGKSLRAICEMPGFPHRITVIRWLSVNEAFATKYARAREVQADHEFDEIKAIADETPDTEPVYNREGELVELRLSSAYVAWQKNRIDARKWRAERLKPKAYGNRQQLEHSGPDGGAIEVASSNTEIAQRAAFLLAKAAKAKK